MRCFRLQFVGSCGCAASIPACLSVVTSENPRCLQRGFFVALTVTDSADRSTEHSPAGSGVALRLMAAEPGHPGDKVAGRGCLATGSWATACRKLSRDSRKASAPNKLAWQVVSSKPNRGGTLAGTRDAARAYAGESLDRCRYW